MTPKKTILIPLCFLAKSFMVTLACADDFTLTGPTLDVPTFVEADVEPEVATDEPAPSGEMTSPVSTETVPVEIGSAAVSSYPYGTGYGTSFGTGYSGTVLRPWPCERPSAFYTGLWGNFCQESCVRPKPCVSMPPPPCAPCGRPGLSRPCSKPSFRVPHMHLPPPPTCGSCGCGPKPPMHFDLFGIFHNLPKWRFPKACGCSPIGCDGGPGVVISDGPAASAHAGPEPPAAPVAADLPQEIQVPPPDLSARKLPRLLQW